MRAPDASVRLSKGRLIFLDNLLIPLTLFDFDFSPLSPEVPAAGLWSRIWVMRKAHKQLSEKGYRFCAGHLTCRGAAQQATTGRIIFRGVCMPRLNAADLPAFLLLCLCLPSCLRSRGTYAISSIRGLRMSLSFENLPNDILRLVFSFCPISDLLGFRTVNRRWKDVASQVCHRSLSLSSSSHSARSLLILH